MNSTRRGSVQMFLRSPMGTRSMILSERPNDDDSQDGFTKWPFMTTHTWAEYPRGKWTLEVTFIDGPHNKDSSKNGPCFSMGPKMHHTPIFQFLTHIPNWLWSKKPMRCERKCKKIYLKTPKKKRKNDSELAKQQTGFLR